MPKNEPVKLRAFVRLCELFKERGYHAYLVGGSVRDYLLKKNFSDLDIATDATPEEMKLFLNDVDYTFAKFGSVKVKCYKFSFDVTTFRKESEYRDFRHPGRIEFTRDIKVDALRRDFTINALYLDQNFEVLDLVGGKKDIDDKIIRMIGNPLTRLKEDPLRIVRALRFSYDLDFKIEEELAKAINENVSLLKELNVEKIKQEVSKCQQKEKLLEYLKKVNVL